MFIDRINIVEARPGERAVDEALEMTFPASDPPAWMPPGAASKAQISGDPLPPKQHRPHPRRAP